MILTCPSCETQYAVKDGAIPAQGRKVRCASCGHSWHVQAEGSGEANDAPAATEQPAPLPVPEEQPRSSEDDFAPGERAEEPLAEAPSSPPIPPESDVVGLTEAGSSGRLEWTGDDEFSPFARRDGTEVRRRSGIILAPVAVLLIAALAAGLWFLAPTEWRERLGLASADETPLQLMMTHSDRQPLASGNELLTVSGRVINPTSKPQKVLPIRAELKSSTGKVVFSWTIPPPAPTLAPGESKDFVSAHLDVPPGAEELTVTLGQPKA
jgi:predicted Zn finger-like uncharacterized protein